MIVSGKIHSVTREYDASCRWVRSENVIHIAYNTTREAIAAAVKQGWKLVHAGSNQVWKATQHGGILVRTFG